ncbi:L-idonate 5-dehydrogenase [Leifsonia sp. ZF2019]|uniref:L-idonate 5-dehydrogenase n=1 Tax=Leifsonia sp. ZF2019 TaxID=2781978 RepID=UPI001CBEE253|nr:L-idonate 5-dehydrogenase [Leifsonia sp. ZF2019]UAJ78390.1 L-idonate 5-dehydrogenase [Leifsonia sp. ZF2019]
MTVDTTRAVVAHGAGDLRVDHLPLADPAPDEAIVAVAYGGVCGSDLHYWTHGAAGESVLRAPMVLGHEVVGIVADAAADGSGPAAGTAVAVHPATPLPGDGSRYPEDRSNLAPGATYLGSAARIPHTAGAFADRVVLPTRMLRALPSGLPLRTAALAEPAAVAWHAVRRAGEVRGARALVIGSGPIGALAVAVLRRAGAAEIVATDLHELPRSIATAAGATRTIDARDAEAVAALDADVVIESSGTVPGLAAAIAGATRGGRVVLVGLLPPGDQPVPIARAISRELELVGSFRFVDELDEVIAALADGSLDVSAVVTHEFPAEEALHAFGIARDASVSGKVLLRFGAADDPEGDGR